MLDRYADYEEMDAYPEISKCLGDYADDATTWRFPPSVVDRLAALGDPSGQIAKRVRRYDEDRAIVVRITRAAVRHSFTVKL